MPAQARGRTVHPHEAPRERWPRFTVEVPPELAVLLDTVSGTQRQRRCDVVCLLPGCCGRLRG
ncbi:MAG: hypothetical protein WA484_06240 [Solirubrobacteraceae bacterium]